jgi:hypothetical protein
MSNFTCATGESGDLFDATPVPARHASTKPWPAPALTTARALCRRLRHNNALPEKQRLAHLICLNLLSMLKRDTRRA